MNKLAVFALAASQAHSQSAPLDTLKPTLDVGVIVSDIDKAKEFYGGMLGLKLAGTLPMPDGNTMYRYQAGTATLKVRTATPKPAKYPTAVRGAIGIRLLTLYVDDFGGIVGFEAGDGSVSQRTDFGAAGYAAPGQVDTIKKIFLSRQTRQQHERLLVRPAADDRIVTGFIGAGITAGEVCVVIATSSHRAKLELELTSLGIDLPTSIASGYYVALDAADVEQGINVVQSRPGLGLLVSYGVRHPVLLPTQPVHRVVSVAAT